MGVNVDGILERMDLETEQAAEPLARELIEAIDRFFIKHRDDDEPADVIYFAREATIEALVYVLCLWCGKDARLDDVETTIVRIKKLVDERIKAN